MRLITYIFAEKTKELRTSSGHSSFELYIDTSSNRINNNPKETFEFPLKMDKLPAELILQIGGYLNPRDGKPHPFLPCNLYKFARISRRVWVILRPIIYQHVTLFIPWKCDVATKTVKPQHMGLAFQTYGSYVK